MSSYAITGDLGSGKSLISVTKIQEYLLNNRKVATNLDIHLEYLLPHHSKHARLTRLPDYPNASHLWALGEGNDDFYDAKGNRKKIYDKDRNGLIVLDETVTILGSREWGGNERQNLIKFLIHTRKQGWDVIYIVQDIEMIDKQVRKALIEYRVLCRSSNKFNIAFITKLGRLLQFNRLIPDFYVGFVYLGISQRASQTEKWTAVGTKNRYLAYDTRQKFIEGIEVETKQGTVLMPEVGMHTVLPPYYTHGRYQFSFPRWSYPIFIILLLLPFAYIVSLIYSASTQYQVVENIETEQTEQTETTDTEQTEVTDNKPQYEQTKALYTKNKIPYLITQSGQSLQIQGYNTDEKHFLFTTTDNRIFTYNPNNTGK